MNATQMPQPDPRAVLDQAESNLKVQQMGLRILDAEIALWKHEITGNKVLEGANRFPITDMELELQEARLALHEYRRPHLAAQIEQLKNVINHVQMQMLGVRDGGN